MTNGYLQAWNSFTKSEDYKRELESLTRKGSAKKDLVKISKLAFDAGWRLLIDTFIEKNTAMEKRYPRSLNNIGKKKVAI